MFNVYFDRAWWFEMPNKWTFRMKKLRSYILSYVPNNSKVLIPFAGQYRFKHGNCEFIYNDIKKDIPADYHIDAYLLKDEFEPETFDVIIADPPYTHYQSVKTYGNKRFQEITMWRKTALQLLKPGGIYIELGYNSTGLRMKHAKRLAVANVNMGGSHNDIIIVVQKKNEKASEVCII